MSVEPIIYFSLGFGGVVIGFMFGLMLGNSMRVNGGVGLYMRERWSGPIMFYQFKCPKHGYVVNYPQGHAERMICPVCQEQEIKEAAKGV